jgi:hypothetical protein
MDRIQEYEIHERILGIQSFTLFQLMNPWTVNRLYDNMLKVSTDQDLIDVPELFDTLASTVWSELDQAAPSDPTNRKPAISSIRRNLQRAHLSRLVDAVLSKPGWSLNADCHAVARMNLKKLGERIQTRLDNSSNLDAYTMAHLSDSAERIKKALDADFFAEGHGGSGGGGIMIILGQEQGAK